jgi:hypothetical protein
MRVRLVSIALLSLIPGAAVAEESSSRKASIDSMRRLREAYEKMGSGRDLSWYADFASKTWKAAQSGRDLLEDYPPLTDADASCGSGFDPEGMPKMPVHCVEEAEGDREPPSLTLGTDGAPASGCECFQQAYRDLRFVRKQLAKLRCIYVTTRDLVEFAEAFGDDVSSFHGAMGLMWQSQKFQIEESMDNLRESYDEQYQNGMNALRKALKTIASCEAEHFDEPDWYNRFGFIYYQFMADRYKRSD